MGLNHFSGSTVLGREPLGMACEQPRYPRLVSPEVRAPLSRSHPLGMVGGALLELPWLVWMSFDVVVVAASVYLAYGICVWALPGSWLTFGWRETCLIQCPAFILSALVFGLYEHQTLLRRSRIVGRSLLIAATAVIVTFLVIQLVMYETQSRRVLMVSGLIVLLFSVPIRLLAGWCVNNHSRKFVIVGTDRKSRLSLAGPEALTSDALTRRYQLVGYIALEPIEVGRRIDGATVIGTIENLEDICLDMGVNEIVVAPGAAKNTKVLELTLGCLKLGCRVTNLTNFYEQVMSEVPVSHLDPSWFLFADLKHYREAQLTLKRVCDLCGAILGLVLTLPIWPLLALLIRLDSRGPIFYHQQRVGLNGRRFRLHKFRTMCVEAESEGHQWARVDDPRITRVGWYLRKTRLDELPQLWNILLGHMSIIGPRPERPEFVEELAQRIRFYNERHLIKPGLSGWAQINYRYGASIEDAQRKLQLDLWYIKHMSLELDALIFLRTLGTMFLGSR